MKLSETAAIVTGGASGLGEATARHFAANGAQVTILDRDAERGEKVAAEIGGYFAQTDVTDEASVQAAIDMAKAKMGKINACVNCAGIAFGIKTMGKDGPHPLDKYRRTIDINLVGTFNVARRTKDAIVMFRRLCSPCVTPEYPYPGIFEIRSAAMTRNWHST